MFWYSAPPEAVVKELGTDREQGLTSEEAAARLETAGPNRLREKPPRGFWQRFFLQMKSAMVIILLLAAAVSLGISIYHVAIGELGDWIEPIVIVIIVLLNALLGALQESKAEAALDALKTLSSPSARVVRDAAVQIVKATELVPGDVVEFEAGDVVPADCRLLEASSLQCDESSLTGESLPVQKDAAALLGDLSPLSDRVNMTYSGCAVVYGRGRGIVVETGMQTEMGKIATMLEGEGENVTPLQKKLGQLGKLMGYLALAICAVIFVVGLIGGLGLLDMFMTAVSLAVAAIPEGLPAIVTIVLALGVQRMVAKNAIIRRLPAVETLGSATVICTDKTGTLTKNRMTVKRLFAGGRFYDLEEEVPDGVKALIRLAVLCTNATVTVVDGKEQPVGDPTETALVSCARQYGMEKETLETEYPRLGELPFDSERKMMTVIHLIEGRHVVIVKGAPDVLLSRCVDVDERAVSEANAAMGEQALRVLAVGYKYIDNVPVDPRSEELETDLSFVGLIGMIDPPREEAVTAIEECRCSAIRTVMITGDHIVTAKAIARELRILTEGTQALSGQELAALSDEELFATIRNYSVYARVSPADKLRIVKAWQRAGEVVAMTGDGVNDAPALKAADIGCAMGITGTDVAKGAADVVLTDDHFATIVTAVREGRGIYDNIRKAIQFLLGCNLGEILTVLFAMLLWRETPLLPVQLLWLNLVTDSLPALALGVEPVERDVMSRPPRKKSERLFANHLGTLAAVQGLMFGGLTLLAYFIGSRGLSDASMALGETMAFAVLALSQIVHAFNVRSAHSLFRVGFHTNKYMLGAFAGSLLLMLGALCLPIGWRIFGVTTMTGLEWGIVAGLSISPLLISESGKGLIALIRRRRKSGEEAASA